MTKTVYTVMLFLLLVGMLTLTFTVQPARATEADSWPMFRHDFNHTGTSTSTGPTTNNVLWTYTTGGLDFSSPAVVGGLVYVGSEDTHVYCLNATTGSLVWNYKIAESNGVYSSPAVVNGVVYVGSSNYGVVYAFSSGASASTITIIIIGVIVAVIIIATLVFMMFRKRLKTEPKVPPCAFFSARAYSENSFSIFSMIWGSF